MPSPAEATVRTPASISYGRRIADLAALDPHRIALRFAAVNGAEQAFTLSQLDDASTVAAHALLARGVGVGDRVALSLHNSPQLVAVLLGAWKVGAVPVPVRWDLPEWERRRVFEVVAAAVNVDDGNVDRLFDQPGTASTGPLEYAVSPQTHGICSSGSTGTPKVIVIERPAVWNDALLVPFPTAWGQSVIRPQVVLVPGPAYHTNGFTGITKLLCGDEVVLMEKFGAAQAVDLIERHRVTTMTAATPMFQRIADLPGIDDRDLTSISWVLQGASAIAPSLVARWAGLIGAERLYMAYGMSEGLGTTVLRADEYHTHSGSVGRGYLGTEARILGPNGDLLPPGEIGDIYLRSSGGDAYSYLGATDERRVRSDGFGTAGDLGWLDADGYLYIADRRVDLIKTGGANVFPAEVESALIDHPGIADVVVIGLSDPTWGRRVHAVVEPADRTSPRRGPTSSRTPKSARGLQSAEDGGVY